MMIQIVGLCLVRLYMPVRVRVLPVYTGTHPGIHRRDTGIYRRCQQILLCAQLSQKKGSKGNVEKENIRQLLVSRLNVMEATGF